MKIPFTQDEVAAMVVGALENGWNPCSAVQGVTYHSGQSDYCMTLDLTEGMQLRMTKQAVQIAIGMAFRDDAAPVTIKSPDVRSVTFHQSKDRFVQVEVVSTEVSSRFGSPADENDED